jgi:hypothetical protein
VAIAGHDCRARLHREKSLDLSVKQFARVILRLLTGWSGVATRSAGSSAGVQTCCFARCGEPVSAAANQTARLAREAAAMLTAAARPSSPISQKHRSQRRLVLRKTPAIASRAANQWTRAHPASPFNRRTRKRLGAIWLRWFVVGDCLHHWSLREHCCRCVDRRHPIHPHRPPTSDSSPAGFGTERCSALCPCLLLLRSVSTDAHGLPAIPTSVTEHHLGSAGSPPGGYPPGAPTDPDVRD